MLLTFSKDQFVEKILTGDKIHSIREDKNNRWKIGMKIHFWRGNPRNVKSNPYEFATSVVKDIQRIEIEPSINWVSLTGGYSCFGPDGLEIIAKNDGFSSWAEMKKFFPEPFVGKLIWWEQIKITA